MWQFDDALALQDLPKTIEELRSLEPRLIGVAIPAQQATEVALGYIRELRVVFPHAFICTGGIFASYAHRELLLREGALDGVVRGEGERTLPEVVDTLEQGRSLAGIQGLSYRAGSRLVVNSDRPLESDFLSLYL